MSHRPDPKNSSETKDLLRSFMETMQEMKASKLVGYFDSLSLQATPSRATCAGNPEREYLHNVVFRKGEEESDRGLNVMISHEKD